MRRTWSLLSALAMILIAALACNLPQRVPTPDLAQIVAQTQTALALPPVATTPPPSPSPTPLPSIETPTLTPSPSPSLTPTPLPCINRAKFISETIPDNTPLQPGQTFVKTWVLQNNGDCTWTPDYTLVFSHGIAMGGETSQPIGQTVPPNGFVTLNLTLTAPDTPGTYQGFWKLRDPAGREFGLGGDASVAFWAKIVVLGGTPTLSALPVATLGAPTRLITFEGGKAPFALGNDDKIGFAVKEGRLVLTAFQKAGDLWRVAELGLFTNFAIEVRFTTGPTCAGRDDYGLLLRAPRQPDSIIDSGMVFGFSCEGKFRIYRMDNGVYNGLVNWSAHPALRAGPNQENVIVVIAQGDRYLLYINDTLVYDLRDATYEKGLFGLMIGSAGTPNFRVAVSQIALWNLP